MKENLERRQRILNAARDVFAREGFRNAEVKTIATQAGVGKATIYKHFASKEDLLLNLVKENFSCIRDLALKNLVGAGRPLQRFERTCMAIAEYLTQNRNFSTVVIREAGEFLPEIQRIYNTVVGENQAFADAFFDAMKSEGMIPDVPNHTLLELLMNLTIGTIYSWTLTEDRDLRRDVEYLFTLWHERSGK